MMLMLSADDLARLSDGARSELLALLAHPRDHGHRGATHLAELSVDQARAYVTDLSETSLAALRAMAEAPEDGFTMFDIAKAIDADGPGALRTLWGGLRKRAATITGDPGAVLVKKSTGGPEGDRRGQLHPETRRALRAIFGMEVEV